MEECSISELFWGSSFPTFRRDAKKRINLKAGGIKPSENARQNEYEPRAERLPCVFLSAGARYLEAAGAHVQAPMGMSEAE